MQIMNEQAEIEFRLERMEQEMRNEGDKLDDQEIADAPEYMLATKYKAMISPVVRFSFHLMMNRSLTRIGYSVQVLAMALVWRVSLWRRLRD
jgi:hypothetical protein